MATSNVKLKSGEVVPMTYPDNWTTEQVEKAIHDQFPDEGANESQMEETPLNQKESQLQAAPKFPEEPTGITGVGSDIANMFSKALSGATGFANRAPENFRKIKQNVSENGVAAVGHMYGQGLAEIADLAKSAANSPHDFAKYLIRKHLASGAKPLDMYALVRDKIGDKVKLPEKPNDFADLIPRIPENTGVEKLLGLEPKPEKGDELIRGLVDAGGLVAGGYEGAAAFNRWLKSPDKFGALTRKLEAKIPEAEETHASAQEAHGKAKEAHAAEEAHTKAVKEGLEEKFSAEHGSKIGTLTPSKQRTEINIKKSKQAEKAEAMAIPEKDVGEIPPKPSTEHLTKKVDDAVKASEDARKGLVKTLGTKEHPTHKAGETLQNAIQKVKDEASALYNAGRKHFVEHNVQAANGAEIKAVTEELTVLKNSDELAPGYGHGSEEQKALESTLEALKGEKVAASDVFDLQQHATHLAKKYRQKAFSGVSELEKKHYLNLADKMQTHADGLAKRLETVGGKDVQKMFTEANKGWRTYHEAKQNTVGGAAKRKGEIPSSAMLDIARKETGNKFMQALVENDPELRKQFLAAHIGPKGIPKGSAGAFEEPTSLVVEYMKQLPEVEERVKALQRALSAVKETKTATKAEAEAITKAHKDLEKSMKEEASRQAERQAAHQEHGKLDREIKSHEAAIPKLEERIKAEEATMKDVKSTAAEVDRSRTAVAKAKSELAAHRRALAEKYPRKEKLKKYLGRAVKALGISHGLHKIGL